jgi:hypothetical protein
MPLEQPVISTDLASLSAICLFPGDGQALSDESGRYLRGLKQELYRIGNSECQSF